MHEFEVAAAFHQRLMEIFENWERIDWRQSRKQNVQSLSNNEHEYILVLSIEINQIITKYYCIRVSSRIKKIWTEELRFDSCDSIFPLIPRRFFFFSFTFDEEVVSAIEEENVNTTSERRRINRGENVPIEGKVGIKAVPGQRGGNGVAAFWNAAGKSALLGEEGWRSNFDRVTTAI